MLSTTKNPHGYWLSKGVVYWGSTRMENADPATFEALNESWGRDKKNVYWATVPVRKADPTSFRMLNELYAKDSDRCFTCGQEIKGADAATFRVLDSGIVTFERRNSFGDVDRTLTFSAHQGYACDDHSVFHYVLTIGKPNVLKGADVETFQVLGSGFAKDKNHVYFERTRLKGADPESFTVIPPSWGKDKCRVYFGSTLMSGADPNDFAVLSSSDALSTDGRSFL